MGWLPLANLNRREIVRPWLEHDIPSLLLPLSRAHWSLYIFQQFNLHPPACGRVEAEGRGFGEGARSVSNRCPPLAALDPPASGRVKLCRDQCGKREGEDG